MPKDDTPDTRHIIGFIILCVALLFYLGLPVPSLERSAPPDNPFEEFEEVNDEEEMSGELLYSDARVDTIDDSHTVHLSNYEDTGKLASIEIVSKSDNVTEDAFDMSCAEEIQTEAEEYLEQEVYGPYEYQVIEYETEDGEVIWQLRENLVTTESDAPPVGERLVSQGYAFYDDSTSTVVSYETAESTAVIELQGIWRCYNIDEE